MTTAEIDDADGLTNPVFSYQWVRIDGVTETNISGANGQIYLLTVDDVGFKVVATFLDDRGEVETVESNAFPPSGTIQNKPNRQPRAARSSPASTRWGTRSPRPPPASTTKTG